MKLVLFCSVTLCFLLVQLINANASNATGTKFPSDVTSSPSPTTNVTPPSSKATTPNHISTTEVTMLKCNLQANVNENNTVYFKEMVVCASGLVLSILFNIIACCWARKYKRKEWEVPSSAVISRRKELGTITRMFLPNSSKKNIRNKHEVKISYDNNDENADDVRVPTIAVENPLFKIPRTRSPKSPMMPVLQLIPRYSVSNTSKLSIARGSCSSEIDLIHLEQQINNKNENNADLCTEEDIYVNHDMIRRKNLALDLELPIDGPSKSLDSRKEKSPNEMFEDEDEDEEIYLSLNGIEDEWS